MPILFADTETFSKTPIKNGTFAYAENCEVMLWAYAFDDSETKLWDRASGEKMPVELENALKNPEVTFVFHNAMFDLTVIRESLGIDIPINRVHCTMARAYAHGLPGSLSTLSEIFNLSLDKAKDKQGKKLIQLFCVPRKTGNIERATSKTHPVEWEAFRNYAKLDIESMRELYKKIPNWNYTGDEYDLWCLDHKINRRGFLTDLDLATSAVKAVGRTQAILADRTSDLSLGDLKSTTQRDETLRHILQAYGVELPDLQMSTVERRMEDPDLPIEVKELLAIRLQASTSSTAKYSKLIKGASKDGRLRGTLQFAGASRTSRWGGRLFQPHNLPRPNLDQKTIEFGIEALKADCADLYFDNIMEITSNAIRGCIISPLGKKLTVSDLSGIEGRVLPWLSNEEWKLKAYKDYDAGIGPDNYNLSYANAFRISPEEVSKLQRAIGKVMELMLGFGGSVGAFITGAASYKIDLVKMAAGLIHTLPTYAKEKALASWEWAIKENRTYDLEKDVYVVCRALTEMWRNNHPKVVKFWADLEKYTIEAIENKGTEYTTMSANCGIRTRRDGNWLRLILPSGRSLCYAAPRYDDGVISYMGMNQYSRRWERIKTYSGKLAENVTQATARDILAANMPLIEDYGYEVLLTVHDEVISEAPDTPRYSAEGLSSLLATQPWWASGLPLAAKGFEGYRYKKDD